MATTEFLDLTQITITVSDDTATPLEWVAIWRTGSIGWDTFTPPYLNELVMSESNGGHTGVSYGARKRVGVTFETQADQFIGSGSVGTLVDMLNRTAAMEFAAAVNTDTNSLAPHRNLLIQWDRAANADIKSIAFENCTFELSGAMDDKLIESIAAQCHGRIFMDGLLVGRDRRETTTTVPTWANPS